MQISITATLTEEQALILAKEKGYQDTVANLYQNEAGQNVSDGETPNPESPAEFLRRVYQAMVTSDVTKHFLEYDARKSKAEREAQEAAIKETIGESVTASVT